MRKEGCKRVNSSWLWSTVLLVGLIAPHTHAALTDVVEIRERAQELRAALEEVPYVARGRGPAVYVFQYADCAPCRSLFRDTLGRPAGVESRHVLYAVDQKSANEAAVLAHYRRNRHYGRFMTGKKRVKGDYRTNPEWKAALGQVMRPLEEVILPVLQENGWPEDGLVPPTFIWDGGGKLYASGGYSPERLAEIVASATTPPPAPVDVAQNATPTPRTGTHGAGAGATATNRIQKAREPEFYDIMGVTLGMTREEAEAALQAYDPDGVINTDEEVLRYSDGVAVQETAPYPTKIWATFKGGPQKSIQQSVVSVYLSPPPEGGRVVYVRRTDRSQGPVQLPLVSTYRSALEEKYGAPASQWARQPEGTGGWMLWEFPPDRVRCRPPARAGGMAAPFMPSRNLKAQLQLATTGPVEECGSALLYSFTATSPTSPSIEFIGHLSDPVEAYRAQDAHDAWRERLKEKAVRERLSKGTAKPKL